MRQRPLIDVAIDSAAILIGEQTTLHLTVTADKDRPVQIVIPNDTLMTGVEVLNLSKADSTEIENDRLVIKQDVLITSFDSSLYLLPPLKVIDGVDTVYSNQVALKVSTNSRERGQAGGVQRHQDRMEATFRMGRLLSDHLRDLAGPVLDLRDRLYRETDPCEEVVDTIQERGAEASASRAGHQGTGRDQATENSGSKDEARSITP